MTSGQDIASVIRPTLKEYYEWRAIVAQLPAGKPYPKEPNMIKRMEEAGE
jgi:hypothetical protein